MSAEMKTIDNMDELRKELINTPRSKLKFAKVMTDFLAEHNISVSGDLLGQLSLASCHELEASKVEGYELFAIGTWTNLT